MLYYFEKALNAFSDWMPEITSVAPCRLCVAGPSTSTPPSYVVRTIDGGTNIITADPSQTRALFDVKNRGNLRQIFS
jgi:hypothetical protein